MKKPLKDKDELETIDSMMKLRYKILNIDHTADLPDYDEESRDEIGDRESRIIDAQEHGHNRREL